MNGIIVIALGASVVGTVFFVSLLELFFTMRRRKVHAELEAKVKELKATYNESVNKLIIEGDGKLEETEKHVEQIAGEMEGAKQQVSQEYEAKIQQLKEETEKELEHAKARAKKLEKEAKLKAEEYLASRQEEVEHDLMDLVISVTKKVLPETLTYEIQKELVLTALRDVKAEKPAA